MAALTNRNYKCASPMEMDLPVDRIHKNEINSNFTNFASRMCECIPISLFPKEITVHSGIVWRDKKYCGRRQICENRNKYYQISTFYMTEI